MRDDDPDRPPVTALIAQLAEDTRGFAQAELTYLRAQLGERWSFAMPAFVAMGIGLAMALAVGIALPLGLMVALGAVINPFLAIVLVALAGIVIAGLLLRWGSRRFKAALKKPEDR